MIQFQDYVDLFILLTLYQGEYLGMYTQYNANFPKASSMLQQCRKNNKYELTLISLYLLVERTKSYLFVI